MAVDQWHPEIHALSNEDMIVATLVQAQDKWDATVANGYDPDIMKILISPWHLMARDICAKFGINPHEMAWHRRENTPTAEAEGDHGEHEQH